MDYQAVFDKVWNHFIVKQNPRAIAENGICRYRTEKGLMCAVGCLIPDNEYKGEEMEGAISLERVVSLSPTLSALCGFGTDTFQFNVDFLKDLQRAHDRQRNSNHYNLAARFGMVAQQYSLEIPS